MELVHGLRADLYGLVGANDAFEEALKLDPENAQAKSGLASVKRAIEAEAREDGMGGDPMGGLSGIFSDPQMIQKIASNPKTSSYLSDPQFMATLQRVRQNPNSIGTEMGDPRILQVMGVLMGIDISTAMPGEEGGAASGGAAREYEEDVPMPDAPPSGRPSQPRKAPEPEPEPEPEDEESMAKRKAKEEADKEKALGTESYKKRQFDAAIDHYNKAWETHKDITYLTNMSAAQYEKGDYEGAVKTCETAIQEGREMLADFKLIAKYVLGLPLLPPRSLLIPILGPSAASAPAMKSSVTSLLRWKTTRNPSPSTAPRTFSTSSAPPKRPRSKPTRTPTSRPRKPTKRASSATRNSRKPIGPAPWRRTRR